MTHDETIHLRDQPPLGVDTNNTAYAIYRRQCHILGVNVLPM